MSERPSSVDLVWNAPSGVTRARAAACIQARITTWLCRWSAETLADESVPTVVRMAQARSYWQAMDTMVFLATGTPTGLQRMGDYYPGRTGYQRKMPGGKP